jgi:hypothetical protein
VTTGKSSALRDVRIVTDVLRGGSDWSTAAFVGYGEERRERMRRLRVTAQIIIDLVATFTPAGVRDRSIIVPPTLSVYAAHSADIPVFRTGCRAVGGGIADQWLLVIGMGAKHLNGLMNGRRPGGYVAELLHCAKFTGVESA